MKKEDDLIYDLIFSEKESFKIDISEYISDIYQYEDFIDKIKNLGWSPKISLNEGIKAVYQQYKLNH